MNIPKNWSPRHASEYYRVPKWGMGFFGINAAGHVSVHAGSSELDLYQLSMDLEEQGIGFPVLVRFPHILQHMLDRLYTAFREAIASCNYAGDYVAAYPVKVNQQASVLRHFHQQDQWPVAFEVGSKAELVACLGILQAGNRTIICNGYKDEAYIRLALTGRLLGHDVIIVLESPDELQHVIRQSVEVNVKPVLGMRVRLSAIGEGNWQNTGGERSKFGLTSSEVLHLLRELKENGASGWMRMLHFHMGSQIPSLIHIRAGIEEGMSYFAELSRLGIHLTQLNVGGGLAVDYEGSRSNSYFSMNYCIDEYARCVIGIVHSVCQQRNVPPPTVFTENGRAMAACHAILVTDVIDAEYRQENVTDTNTEFPGDSGDACEKLKGLVEVCRHIRSGTEELDSAVDHSRDYTRLMQAVKQVNDDFSRADISLAEKAHAENIAQEAYRRLSKFRQSLDAKYCNDLEEKLVDKYFCNFSLFQSTPDIWGLNQIFPILPLHRLDEAPTRQVRLHDLTCDSDGQIDRYVVGDSVKPYLSLHEFGPDQKYLIGVFLIGAYQEILGDMHNLFGDTWAVNVELNPDGAYRICEHQPGDTVEKVLSCVHIDAAEMRRTWRTRLAETNASEQVTGQVLEALEAALQAYSYLDSPASDRGGSMG